MPIWAEARCSTKRQSGGYYPQEKHVFPTVIHRILGMNPAWLAMQELFLPDLSTC
ncbi:hypothetical protein SELSPUOL_01947 [Selenomonas sputigena ATCC 35185]|uniref:Uncharacterized protein n=1 Tax=Selenomonas sputigena (strain ATCC 35185 / DSM 20758 / CCUG 44933 / VPI D19B-28) TaxID=546271 RepID=C9LWU2_SELS3|nr:hypothetical protein SELSPUOL_01947 [Selenomonas sputigena ATCC 35185]